MFEHHFNQILDKETGFRSSLKVLSFKKNVQLGGAYQKRATMIGQFLCQTNLSKFNSLYDAVSQFVSLQKDSLNKFLINLLQYKQANRWIDLLLSDKTNRLEHFYCGKLCKSLIKRCAFCVHSLPLHKTILGTHYMYN